MFSNYQLTETHYGDMSLSIHDRINDLCRRASKLAPAITESALGSGCTEYRSQITAYGPRQRKAWDMVAEALGWNSISDTDTEVELAEAAERDGQGYRVNENKIVWFATEDENLAAGITRGLADGSLITAEDFLARVEADEDGDMTKAIEQAKAGLRFWVVCDEHAAGPYSTREVAERAMGGFDCISAHQVVASVTQPVTRYEALQAEQDAADELAGYLEDAMYAAWAYRDLCKSLAATAELGMTPLVQACLDAQREMIRNRLKDAANALSLLG